MKEILSISYDLRNSKEAMAFRESSKEFEFSLKNENDIHVIEMINEMEHTISRLSNKLDTPHIPIDISFPIGISFDTDEIIENIKSKNKKHLEFIIKLYKSAIVSRNNFKKFDQLFD